MTELVPHRLNGRGDRRVARELARLDAEARAMQAYVDNVSDLQAARIHGLAFVGTTGLHAVAWVSEAEQQLCRIVPEAAERLTTIANVTALGVAELVAETPRELKR